MRRVENLGPYKRDLKRELRGQHRKTLAESLPSIIFTLANDFPLEPRYHDHALIGNWKGSRDCHIKPDLILIYRKPDPESLHLVRLGSHSELGL
ncbi:addiction module toxin RelE [Alphaproteobacteria bacterium]|nr:addiction module toxin RelE [Alphaproteobacteria bacterium]